MPNISPSENSTFIRQAYSSEAQLISQLALRSKGHWGYDQEFLRQCTVELSYTPEQLSSPRFYFAVAENNTQIVGFYGLNLCENSTTELEALFVEPASIGLGIGKMLLSDALHTLKQRGAEKLLIQGDPNATEFYQRNGGKLIGQLASHSIPGRNLPLFEINV
ncbi:MAG: N-acetylglutamate synthase-like GNAT family acetyltransferase [Paraglaciecola sp.]|jgi:N-acetylglutamate synthase-like GNAT family acetyltransferase